MVVCVPTVLEGRVTFLSFGNVEKIVSLILFDSVVFKLHPTVSH